MQFDRFPNPTYRWDRSGAHIFFPLFVKKNSFDLNIIIQIYIKIYFAITILFYYAALYSAIGQSLDILQSDESTTATALFENWLIVLTDGEDNNSSKPYDSVASVKARITTAVDVGVIIIGVGSDVQTEVGRYMNYHHHHSLLITLG